MRDFYDDAISAFDKNVARIFDHLTTTGKFSNTLVVVYSDHGQKWSLRARTPLLFSFPNQEHARRLQVNTQNLDIAPTILDYLGSTIPAWMSGQSLISRPPPLMRPIFGAGYNRTVFRDRRRRSINLRPPLYSMGLTTMVVCDRIYVAHWADGWLLPRNIVGHTSRRYAGLRALATSKPSA